MKKPSRQIREEIARLQEQLRAAETREAERIGRLALKAGLGEIEIEEPALLEGFEELATRFRDKLGKASGRRSGAASKGDGTPSPDIAADQAAGERGEA